MSVTQLQNGQNIQKKPFLPFRNFRNQMLLESNYSLHLAKYYCDVKKWLLVFQHDK